LCATVLRGQRPETLPDGRWRIQRIAAATASPATGCGRRVDAPCRGRHVRPAERSAHRYHPAKREIFWIASNNRRCGSAATCQGLLSKAGRQLIDTLHDPMPRLWSVVPARANQGNAVRVRPYTNPRLPPQL